MQEIDFKAMVHLQACRRRLKPEQYRDLRQQVLAGDPDGAMKGLREILLMEGTNAIKLH
jgi:hypothetical protein